MPGNRRAVLWASLVLVLIGVADGVYLTDLHHQVYVDATSKPICDVNETLSCSDIALSRYAVFLRVPVAVWALYGNGVLVFFLVWALRLPDAPAEDSKKRRHRPPTWPSGLYFLSAAVGLVVTLFMLVIAEFVIGHLCLGCLVMYVTNPLVFAGSYWLLKQDPGAVARDLRGWNRYRPVRTMALVAGVVAGLLVAFYPKYWEQPHQSECDGLPTGVAGDGTCWVGAPQPIIEITEFSDYLCPYCRIAHTKLRDLVRLYPDKIRLIHKHYPLDSSCNPMMKRQLHAGACRMARMAYCAGQQGKFWSMNDHLFGVSKDTTIDPSGVARELGLDVGKFEGCLDTPDAEAHVKKDVDEAMKLKIEGTPTFLIDDLRTTDDDPRKLHVGEVPLSYIESRLQ